jgi:ribosomal protein S18 acetylase RimI-like enzyme
MRSYGHGLLDGWFDAGTISWLLSRQVWGRHEGMADVKFERVDGPGTLAMFDEVQTVYHAAFPSYDLADHRTRTTRQAKSPGFSMVTARTSDGEMLGFAYGLPLSAQSTWWSGLDPSPDDGFVRENGARTFAVIDLCVTSQAQGHGLGHQLMDALLDSRPEERATLASAPHEVENQKMYERWGWHEVGQIPGSAGATEATFLLYVIAVRPVTEASRS